MRQDNSKNVKISFETLMWICVLWNLHICGSHDYSHVRCLTKLNMFENYKNMQQPKIRIQIN